MEAEVEDLKCRLQMMDDRLKADLSYESGLAKLYLSYGETSEQRKKVHTEWLSVCHRIEKTLEEQAQMKDDMMCAKRGDFSYKERQRERERMDRERAEKERIEREKAERMEIERRREDERRDTSSRQFKFILPGDSSKSKRKTSRNQKIHAGSNGYITITTTGFTDLAC